MTPPDVAVDVPDLAQVEAAFRHAIDTGDRSRLPLAGSGELTVAVRWRDDATECVLKRVPPFRTRARADQYMAVVTRHIGELQSSGVRCVATGQHALERTDGSVVVYQSQPLLDAGGLADQILRVTEPVDDHPVVAAIVDRIVGSIASGVPIDGQAANWYWFDGEPWQLDLSTPLYVNADGSFPYDATAFLQQIPTPVRWYVLKEFRRLAAGFSDAQYVITDVMTQLTRQRLQRWCPMVARYSAGAHGIEVSPADAEERVAEEAKFYPWLHRLKLTQRWWLQHTGRKFDTLLPESSTYG